METDRAGAREKVQLAILGSYREDGTLDERKLKENLDGIPGANVGEQNIQEENLNVEVDEYTFEITKEGEVKDKGTVIPQPEMEEVEAGEIVTESNKKYIDKNNEVAIIPVGFKVSEEEGEQVIDKGLVIKDSEENEFVWIPVTNPNSYIRNLDYQKTFTGDIKNDTNYLPEGIIVGEPTQEKTLEDLTFEKEKELVTKKGVKGFYISRYEAGDSSVEANRTSATDGTLVSKKDAYVYNWISQTEAKEKAKTFKVKDDTKVKSGLCTGIQWDMVMAFVNGKKDGNGNDYNVREASYDAEKSNRHTGKITTSGQNLADKVCNIYDLEGNCYEYVAEKNSTTSPYICRGGYYGSNPASLRVCRDDNADKEAHSFRFVLYIM